MSRARGRQAPIPAPTTTAPAAASAFRARSETGEVYDFPGCGLPAQLRRPSLMELSVRGAAPNPLANEVMSLIAADEGPADLSHEERISRYQRNARAYIEVAKLCMVSPRLVTERAPDYDAGEIGPGDIADLDYIWLWHSFVGGAASEVQPFRADR